MVPEYPGCTLRSGSTCPEYRVPSVSPYTSILQSSWHSLTVGNGGPACPVCCSTLHSWGCRGQCFVFCSHGISFAPTLVQVLEGTLKWAENHSLQDLPHTFTMSLYLPLQVLLDIIITVELGQMNENPSGTAAISSPAVTAIADPTAGRTCPLLGDRGEIVPFIHSLHRRAGFKPLLWSLIAQRSSVSIWGTGQCLSCQLPRDPAKVPTPWQKKLDTSVLDITRYHWGRTIKKN